MENEVKKTKFKDTMAGPTVVLLIICLIVSGALAFTYQLTAPQIEKINKENADAARLVVLPDADSFTAVEGDLPDGVAEYYVADNGSGVVVTTEEKSFGGIVTVMVGLDSEGTITGVKVTSHADTPGLGTKAHAADYLEKQYVGKSSTDNADSIKKDSQVSAVTGATVSSNAVYAAVNDAVAAFGEMGGIQ